MSDYSQERQKLDELENILRKQPQVGKPKSKIPINHEKYPQLWFDHQEDLDAYDALMRKKIFFQNNFGDQGEKDFVLEGYRTTFGIFVKEFKERRLEVSDLLKRQLDFLETLPDNKKFTDMLDRRYHTYSDFNHQWEWNRNYLKIALGYLVLRELPIVNFYARSFIMGLYLVYMVTYHWRYVWMKALPEYYMNFQDKNEFANYPLLQDLVFKRVANRNKSPTVMESDYWWSFQFPTFYQSHMKHYRYIFRNAREVQWDGTYNQPIFPYMQPSARDVFVSSGLTEAVVPAATATF